MARLDPQWIKEITRARLLGSEAQHNPEWPPYQMYKDIYDSISANPSDAPFLMLRERSSGRGRTAEMPVEDMPMLAPDVYDPETDPRLKNRKPARERQKREPREQVPVAPPPREPEPKQLDITTDQDLPSGVHGRTDHLAPRPEDVYNLLPFLKDDVERQELGEGMNRRMKGNKFIDPSARVAREFESFPGAGHEIPPIQDYRALAIEDMMRKGTEAGQYRPPGGDVRHRDVDQEELDALAPEKPKPPVRAPEPPTDEGFLDMIQRQLRQYGVIK
jgi:hypothetical protein